MKGNVERRAVAEAAARLDRLCRAQHARTQSLGSGLQAQRGLFAVAGGFIGGFVLARLPLHAWLRTGLSVVATAASIARSPLGSIALGALPARRRARQPTAP